MVYASAKDGWAVLDLEHEQKDLVALLDTIVEEVPSPDGKDDNDLQLQIATLQSDSYLGRVGIGRVFDGSVTKNDRVTVCRIDGSVTDARITKLWTFNGLERVEIETAHSGDIVAMVGVDDILPGDTVCTIDKPNPMPIVAIDKPTLSMILMVNNSPFAGLEGKYLTSRQIRERLDKELQHNVALKVADTDRPEAFLISGRGELHLSILIENMRREGYEMQVSKPEVIYLSLIHI